MKARAFKIWEGRVVPEVIGVRAVRGIEHANGFIEEGLAGMEREADGPARAGNIFSVLLMTSVAEPSSLFTMVASTGETIVTVWPWGPRSTRCPRLLMRRAWR